MKLYDFRLYGLKADVAFEMSDDESSFNEIDIERLFVDVLHFDKEDVRRVMRPWEINE